MDTVLRTPFPRLLRVHPRLDKLSFQMAQFCGLLGINWVQTRRSCNNTLLRRVLRVRQEKGAQRLTFWVRRPPGGMEGLQREGEGVKKFVPSLESLFSLGFEGGNVGRPENFAGMSRTPGGVQKVSAKKFVLIFRSL